MTKRRFARQYGRTGRCCTWRFRTKLATRRPSVHRPVSQHPSLWTTPPVCLSSLLLFWEVLPLHKKNRPTILQKRVKCLHLRIKKFYPFRIKLYEQKLLNYVILTISFSPPWYTTHTRPALLCRLGPLCTFAPPLLHPAICSSGPTHTPLFLMPSWMNALETGSRVQLLNEQRRGVFFIGPRCDHSLPMSITDSLTEDIVRIWMNWPLLIRILMKGWWIDWWWSEFEVNVALAVKAANCLQKLSWLSKPFRACLCSESCWQLVSVSQLLTPCESCQSCQQLVTTEITVNSL